MPEDVEKLVHILDEESNVFEIQCEDVVVSKDLVHLHCENSVIEIEHKDFLDKIFGTFI